MEVRQVVQGAEEEVQTPLAQRGLEEMEQEGKLEYFVGRR